MYVLMYVYTLFNNTQLAKKIKEISAQLVCNTIVNRLQRINGYSKGLKHLLHPIYLQLHVLVCVCVCIYIYIYIYIWEYILKNILWEYTLKNILRGVEYALMGIYIFLHIYIFYGDLSMHLWVYAFFCTYIYFTES